MGTTTVETLAMRLLLMEQIEIANEVDEGHSITAAKAESPEERGKHLEQCRRADWVRRWLEGELRKNGGELIRDNQFREALDASKGKLRSMMGEKGFTPYGATLYCSFSGRYEG